MDPFQHHTGKIAVLNEDNVDTDRIMPARFLTRIERSGYGELLFKDVRGADFVLDQPLAKGASILIVGANFGCGSSREHAVWGIMQGGFKAVIARGEEGKPGFGDIFRQNSANCGLLLATLSPADHAKAVAIGTGGELTIDLPAQTITGKGFSASFDIAPASKAALLRGLDLIGTTLELTEAIHRYEAGIPSFRGEVAQPQ